jgi:hypothetical protein
MTPGTEGFFGPAGGPRSTGRHRAELGSLELVLLHSISFLVVAFRFLSFLFALHFSSPSLPVTPSFPASSVYRMSRSTPTEGSRQSGPSPSPLVAVNGAAFRSYPLPPSRFQPPSLKPSGSNLAPPISRPWTQVLIYKANSVGARRRSRIHGWVSHYEGTPEDSEDEGGARATAVPSLGMPCCSVGPPLPLGMPSCGVRLPLPLPLC